MIKFRRLSVTAIAIVLTITVDGCTTRLSKPATPDQSGNLPHVWHTVKDKDEFFDCLRRRKAFPLDPEGIKTLSGLLEGDDLWLAERLGRYGPEPLWPLPDLNERVKRGLPAHSYRDIGAILPDVDSDLPVRAYCFPGRTQRRALVLSGIHGDEGAGIHVAERLRSLLRTALKEEHRPYFTTIVVPVVIPRTRLTGQRYVPGGLGLGNLDDKDRGVELVWQHVEPNQNYPLPGENYDMARAQGAKKPNAPELVARVRAPTGKAQVARHEVNSPPFGCCPRLAC